MSEDGWINTSKKSPAPYIVILVKLSDKIIYPAFYAPHGKYFPMWVSGELDPEKELPSLAATHWRPLELS